MAAHAAEKKQGSMGEQLLKHLKTTGPKMTQKRRSREYLATKAKFDQECASQPEHASSLAIRWFSRRSRGPSRASCASMNQKQSEHLTRSMKHLKGSSPVRVLPRTEVRKSNQDTQVLEEERRQSTTAASLLQQDKFGHVRCRHQRSRVPAEQKQM